jgi:hypothetical protein
MISVMSYKRLSIHFYCTVLMMVFGGVKLSVAQEDCSSQNIPGHFTEIAFPDEDEIYLDNYFKDQPLAEREERLFGKRIRFVENDEEIVVSDVPKCIRMSAIARLYLSINELGTGCQQGYLTGLRINLGFDGSQIVYFFQPVFLCLTEKVPGGESYYRMKSYEGDKYFVYDDRSETFVSHTDNNMQTLCSRLYDAFQIRRSVFSHRFYGFKHDPYFEGDTKSVMFTFQEIFRLYHNNFREETADNCYGRYLKIYNAAQYYHSGLSFNRLKETLFIKTSKISNNAQNFLHAANLAHLCPPSCEDEGDDRHLLFDILLFRH